MTLQIECSTLRYNTALITSPEWLGTAITPSSKLVVMAISTEDLFIFRGKRLINQRLLALKTLEAELMPVTLLVRQILKIDKVKTSIHCTNIHSVASIHKHNKVRLNIIQVMFVIYNIKFRYHMVCVKIIKLLHVLQLNMPA